MLQSSAHIVQERCWDLDFRAAWLQQPGGVAEVERGVDLAKPRAPERRKGRWLPAFQLSLKFRDIRAPKASVRIAAMF